MTRRNQSLDVLRGIAVLLVLGHHSNYYHVWYRIGGIGVDLFFVLSGYLISGLLFSEFKRTGKIDIGRFLVRRGFKIYPAYYFMVLLFLPFTYHHVTWADFTFMGAYWPVFWGHAWSLSVEEHFYLLLPLVFLLSIKVFKSQRFGWIPYTAPLLLVACLLLRYSYALHHSTVYGVTETHLRVDSLFAGVTLSWVKHFSRGISTKRAYLFGIAAAALLAPVLIGLPPMAAATFGYLLMPLSFCCILIWGLNSSWLGKLKPVSRIGFYSYSIYLWHWPIALIFAGIFKPPTFLSFWSYCATAVLVGIAAAKFIEVPMLRVRDRVFPSVNLRTQFFEAQLHHVLRAPARAADGRAVAN